MKLSAVVRRMLAMCPAAWYIFKRSLQLCCALLAAATALLLAERGGGVYDHELYMTAQTLNETAQAVLLMGVLLPVVVEDLHSS